MTSPDHKINGVCEKVEPHRSPLGDPRPNIDDPQTMATPGSALASYQIRKSQTGKPYIKTRYNDPITLHNKDSYSDTKIQTKIQKYKSSDVAIHFAYIRHSD